MIKSYKNRKLCPTLPVQVYRNLTKKCWSLRQNGVVVAHSTEIALKDCTFTVNESGRQRVIKTGHKNVHAWVTGYMIPIEGMFSFSHIIYNPFWFDSFVNEKGRKIEKANLCIFTNKGDVLANFNYV